MVAQVSVLHAVDDELLPAGCQQGDRCPAAWVQLLAQISVAVAEAKNVGAPASGITAGETAKRIATSLLGGKSKAILLGNAAVDHPQAAQLHAWAQWLGAQTGARVGYIGAAAKQRWRLPGQRGAGAGWSERAHDVEQPRKAYLLWNLEPEYDHANPAAAMRALAAADTVVAFTSFRNGALEYADAILPIAPFTETSGTFVNCEGRAQSFNGTVQPFGDARPGWKVLRVIANALGLQGFEYDTPEAVRAQAIPMDVWRAAVQSGGSATAGRERCRWHRATARCFDLCG